eukprot:31505-Pelagococcus_subviridis.AAC.4
MDDYPQLAEPALFSLIGASVDFSSLVRPSRVETAFHAAGRVASSDRHRPRVSLSPSLHLSISLSLHLTFFHVSESRRRIDQSRSSVSSDDQ